MGGRDQKFLALGPMVSFFRLFCCAVLFLHVKAFVFKPLNSVHDVGVNNSITIHSLALEGIVEDSPGIEAGVLVVATRVRVSGISRVQHVSKFYFSNRIKIDAPSQSGFFKTSPKIEVCVHQNPMLSLAQCERESWQLLDKAGSWSTSLSPFQTKFIDIRISEQPSDIRMVVSVVEESSTYRMVFLAVGIALLVLAPFVSAWVPFYYSTAMTLGIILVLVVIVYQTMRLLPTGRKSSLYILVYGSLVGLSTVIVSYFGSLVQSVLHELGLSEDMYNPLAVFLGLGILIIGAWVGYWGVRKFVITDDGTIDDGTAKFVKWAIRLVGSVCLLQSSKDPVFMLLAFLGGAALAYVLISVRFGVSELRDYFQEGWSSEPLIGKGVCFQAPRKPHKALTESEIEALRRLPGKEALATGVLRSSGNSRSVESPIPGRRRKQNLRPPVDEAIYVSTFHKSPGKRPMSTQQYQELSGEYTTKVVEELEHTKEFRDWQNKNLHRFYVAPSVD